MKKLFVLWLIILVGFCSCDNQDETNLYYSTTFTDFTTINDLYPDMLFNFSLVSRNGTYSQNHGGEIVFYTTYIADITHSDVKLALLGYNHQASAAIIYTIESNDFHVIKFTENADSDSPVYYDIIDFFQLRDDRFVAELYITPPPHPAGEEAEHNGSSLALFDSDGQFISSRLFKEIDPRIGRDGVKTQLSVLSTGDIYILSDEVLLSVTPTGEISYQIDLTKAIDGCQNGKVSDLQFIQTTEESAWIFYRNTTDTTDKLYLREIKPETATLGETVEIIADRSITPILAPGSDFYTVDTYGLNASTLIDDTGGQYDSQRLLYWTDTNLSYFSSNIITILSEDHLVITLTDPLSGKSMIANLTGSEEKITDKREVIDIAYEESDALVGQWDLLNYVRNFNIDSKDYRIRLTAFNTDEVATANEKLLREVISGNIPDIILFGATISPEPFIKYDAFYDLYDLIDRDKKYTRDEFLPCVLKPFETSDGKLPYLTASFSLEMLFGKTSLIGDRSSWTVEDVIRQAGDLEDGQYFMKVPESSSPRLDLFILLLRGMLSDYIDYETGVCDFSGDFTKLLDGCQDIPLLVQTDEVLPSRYHDGNILLKSCYASSYIFYLQDRADFEGTKMSAIGYPSQNAEEGAVIIPEICFSISKQSDCIEGAWDFITYYLDCQVKSWEDCINNSNAAVSLLGIPSTRTATDKMMEAAKASEVYVTPREEFDENMGRYVIKRSIAVDQKPRDKDDKAAIANQSMYIKAGATVINFTDTDEALLRRMLEKATTVYSRDEASLAIIREEASAYYAGTATLDETIARITDRIETRLNE